MSGNFHPSLFWQFSDVSFHPLHMLVLSLIDNWVLVISVHTVSFSWYVRKSVFCNIYPVCICTYLLPYFLWIHTCVIRAHFCSGNKKVLLFNPKVFISFYQMTMQFDCELVNFWTFECTWDIFAPWSQNLLLMNFELPMGCFRKLL